MGRVVTDQYPFTRKADLVGVDTAQVCRRGHLITGHVGCQPETMRPFCGECGSPTLAACLRCDHAIPGAVHLPTEFISPRQFEIPNFCSQCGHGFPWTAERLEAAQAFARELDGLSAEEREALAQSMADLVSDTPRTPLAVTRLKKAVQKVTKPVGDVLYKLAVDIASEAAAKSLKGA